MSQANNPNVNHEEFEHTTKSGVKLYVELSPCAWMYPHYGMQVRVSETPNGVNAASHFVKWDQKYAKATQRSIIAAIEKQMTAEVVAELRKRVASWNVYDAKFRAADKRAVAKLTTQQKRLDLRAVVRGMRFRIDATVHAQHGDDVGITWYAPEAPKRTLNAQARAELKRRGSEVLNSFRIVDLAAVAA